MRPQIIEGQIQTYAWGGYDFLAELTGKPKPDPQESWAELWLGAHPKGPAQSLEHNKGLDELIASDPKSALGQGAERWQNRLPYLLKVLDVRQMLSIQAHPTKAAAEAGFAREEANGPARTAPDRNYRDDNHKPELGLAVTDFYLLHGFKSASEIRRTLDVVPGWSGLISHFYEGGVAALYRYAMEAPQAEIDQLLEPLAQSLKGQNYRSSKAEFWAQRAFQQYTQAGHYDRGIFSIYWFNLVHLQPGEAIFQDAGIPHAYLEGVCVEIMANSDNVLRGGLTVKHIDVLELMENLSFESVVPNILLPQADKAWQTFLTPVDDFELSLRTFTEGEAWQSTEKQACIYLIFAGQLKLDGQFVQPGQAIFQPADTAFSAQVSAADTLVYRARAKW